MFTVYQKTYRKAAADSIMTDLYGKPYKPWDELLPDDHEHDDFTLEELEQVEEKIKKLRGGNLAMDNSRERVRE